MPLGVKKRAAEEGWTSTSLVSVQVQVASALSLAVALLVAICIRKMYTCGCVGCMRSSTLWNDVMNVPKPTLLCSHYAQCFHRPTMLVFVLA